MRTIVLSILVLTLISCDATTKEFIGTSWVVSQLEEKGNNIPVTNDVILTIKSDTEFTLKLDKNNCFGAYTISNGGNIKLSSLGCTEMCCDSKFSVAVTNALYKVSKIKLNKNHAIMSGDAIKIKFKQIEVAKGNMKETNNNTKIIKNGEFTRVDSYPIDVTTKPQNDTTTSVNVPKGETITLYKSPCKGTCEEFTMVMYEDGTVYYTGKFNAKIQGKHTVKLTPKESKNLFKQFEEANYTSFKDSYDDKLIMDIQNTYLTYKGKKIEIRYKPNAPKALKTLLEKVEKIASEVLTELKK